MKVIDCRLRPPIGAYAKDSLFELISNGVMQHCATQHNCALPESGKMRSMEKLIQEMDESDVECGYFAVRNTEICGNEVIFELDTAYPERFKAFAGLKPHDGWEYNLAQIQRFVLDGPAVGIAMEPAIYGTPWYVDDEIAFPIYEFCQKNRIPIMMTYGGRNPADATYYLPAPMEHVAQTFPDLRLLLLHGGWPWVVPTCSLALNYRNIYLCADMYMVNAPGQRDYVDAANYFLSDKLMFGSAYPILSIADTLQHYLHCGIQEKVLPDILYRNAVSALQFQ